MAPVEVVVEGVEGLPRGKALTGGMLGDVNGDGQVTIDDAQLVMTYSLNGSVELPANGDISLGDVNDDGQVTLDDAQLLLVYVDNPTDPSLPAGIGQAVSGSDETVAEPMTGGVLGDVNGDGQVTLDDAVLIVTYSSDGSVELPANGDISLGDVNGDGQVTLDDAQLILVYVNNPADPSLPAGIGQAVPSDEIASSSGGAWVAVAFRRLTDHLADDWSPLWSPDGRYIAFMSDRDGNDDIYVMGSDGSNQRRLTNSGDDRNPSWSPDGRHIAFESDRAGSWRIYVMDSDGSNQRRLTTEGGRYPSWSPDGRHIAFMSWRSIGRGIYVMDSDGSNQRRLTDLYSHSSPVWSPDGRHIAFVSRGIGRGIYVIDSDGSNQRRLTDSDDDWSPVWSPDGRHIAFESDRAGFRQDIYVMDSDGGNQRRLTTYGGRSPVWSPDGRHIAFDGGDVYVMDSDGSNQRNLTDWLWDRFPAVLPDSPVWSPDGRHIACKAFTSQDESRFDEDGANDDIYVMELGPEGSSRTPDGGSAATAIPLAVGESIEGELLAGDNYYFQVSVSSPGTLVASTTGSTDTYGSIEVSSGNVLHEDDDSGEDRNFRVSAVVEPGTYYIQVRGFDASITGAYTLTIQMEEGSDSRGEDWVAGEIRRLTSNSALDYYPVWSPDGRHLAFWSDRDGNWDIYVMDSDGSKQRRLTDHSANDHSPSWSPDGRHLAFVSDRAGSWGIYVMDSDGNNPRLLDYSGLNPSINRAYYWFQPPAWSWSPDGRHIAVVSRLDRNNLYVMESDGSNPRRLTTEGGFSPSWSPDGRHIAFVSRRDRNNYDLYVMGSDGSNPRRLTSNLAYGFYYRSYWSPDGRHIAFVSSGDDSDLGIYVMSLDESNPRRLTTEAGYSVFPSWSPDGRHLAFQSSRDGDKWEIYVMGSDGSNPPPPDHGGRLLSVLVSRWSAYRLCVLPRRQRPRRHLRQY